MNDSSSVLYRFHSFIVKATEIQPTVHLSVYLFYKNLAQGLVLKVPYFWTSFYPVLVQKVP